jgi:hypothetical protein
MTGLGRGEDWIEERGLGRGEDWIEERGLGRGEDWIEERTGLDWSGLYRGACRLTPTETEARFTVGERRAWQ